MSKGQADNLSELLSAYLDGELDDAGCAKVVASLERDPAAVQLLSELREAQGLLRDLPREPAPPDMVSGVVAAVERQALLGTAGDQSSKRVRRNLWRPIRAAAAIVLLVGGAGAYIFWQISEQRDVQLATVIRPAAEDGLAEEHSADVFTGGELALVDRAPDSNAGLRRKKGGDGSRTSPGRLFIEPTAKPELSRARSAGEQAEQTSADTVASTEGWGFDETQVVMLEPDLADDFARSENSRVGQDPPFNSRETGGSRPTLRAIQFGLVGRLGAPSGGRVTTTDFASRLGAAEPAEALSGHAFSNESTVLTLNFETHAQREQFSGAVDHYLLANAFLDVADPIQRGQVTRPEEQNVFLRGNAGVNYAETESQQVLLNAPVEAMTALIDQYTQIVPQPARPAGVDLQIGEIQVQGVEQARAVAKAMGTPEVRRKILGGDDRAADLGNQVAYGVADDRTAEQWQQTYEQFGPTTQQKLGLPGNQVEQMEYANSDEKPEAAKAPRAERQEQDEVGQVARGQVMWADQPTGKADQLSVHRERELQSPQPAEAIGDKDGQIAHKKAKRRARKGGVKGDDEGVLFGARGSGSAGSPMPADELQQVPAENAQQLRRPVTIQDDKDARSQLQRFGNLTFILKLNIVPPAEPQGPPAPIPPQNQPATRGTEG